MILSNCLRIACLVGALSWTAVASEKLDLEKAVGSLVGAEKAYAKEGWDKGFRAASLDNLADEAVIFAPGVVNGKKFWQESKRDPVIKWSPAFASIARSGELGYTTGPSEYRNSRTDEKPEAWGHFVSVWRKNSKKMWQVVFDTGVDHRQPPEAEDSVAIHVPKGPVLHPESLSAGLEKVRKAFAESLKQDEGAAIMASASDAIRIYRRGLVPAVGKTAAAKMIGSERGKTSRTRSGGGTSKAGDLVYEYGEYTTDRQGGQERGMYFCIWEFSSLDNNWKLAVDLQKPAPAPPTQS